MSESREPNMRYLLTLSLLITSLAFAGTQGGGPGGTTTLPAGVVTNSIWAFGALGGTNDDTAVLQAAMNTGGLVTFPATNFSCRGLTIANSGRWLGNGATLNLIWGATNTALIANTNAINFTLSGFVLNGYDFTINSRTNWNRTGINAFAYSTNVIFESLLIEGFDTGLSYFGGAGINGGTLTPSVPHVTTDNLSITGCGCGASFTSPSSGSVVEYLQFVNNEVFNCNTGMVLSTANILIANNQINMNNVGIACGSGVSGVHSEVRGNVLNHNVYAVWCSGCNDYLTFSGNTFAASTAILLSNSKQVSFKGNHFANTAVINGASWIFNGITNGPNWVFDNTYSQPYATNGVTGNFSCYDVSSSSDFMTPTNQLIHWGNYSVDVVGDNDGLSPLGGYNISMLLSNLTLLGGIAGNGSGLTNLIPTCIRATNSPVNGYALRYTNGSFYWAP